jgi:hypothetical protein
MEGAKILRGVITIRNKYYIARPYSLYFLIISAIARIGFFYKGYREGLIRWV